MAENTRQNGPGHAIARGTITGLATYFWSQWLLPWVVPLGLPLITAYVGFLQDLPWTHIAVGASFMFACITTGLVRFDEWKFRNRVEHKLALNTPRLVHDIKGAGFCLGVQVISTAQFPIEMEVVELRTKLANKVPAESVKSDRRLVVPANGFAWWDDCVIAIPKSERTGLFEGLVEYHLRYGHLGTTLKHELRGKQQLNVVFHENGEASIAWNSV